jgi:hypothetical protein
MVTAALGAGFGYIDGEAVAKLSTTRAGWSISASRISIARSPAAEPQPFSASTRPAR